MLPWKIADSRLVPASNRNYMLCNKVSDSSRLLLGAALLRFFAFTQNLMLPQKMADSKLVPAGNTHDMLHNMLHYSSAFSMVMLEAALLTPRLNAAREDHGFRVPACMRKYHVTPVFVGD
jgi:hypothetical protein